MTLDYSLLPPGAADERYHVHARVDIMHFLRALLAQGAFVTVHFGPHRDLIASMLLAVDAGTGVVLLDCSADPAANERLLRSGRLLVSGHLDHVPIHFTAPSAQRAIFQQAPALEVPLPPAIVRMQRREFYRVRVAATRGLHCELPPAVDGMPPAQPVPAWARVANISCGGMNLMGHPAIAQWTPGAVLTGCRLVLPDADVLAFDMEVVHVAPDARRPTIARAGVRFMELDADMRTRLQRYVTNLERELLIAQVP